MLNQKTVQDLIWSYLASTHLTISEVVGKQLPPPVWVSNDSLLFLFPLESRLIQAVINFNQEANKIVLMTQFLEESPQSTEAARFVMAINNMLMCSALLLDAEQGIIARDAIPCCEHAIETLVHTEQMLNAMRNTLIKLEPALKSVIAGEQNSEDAIEALKSQLIADLVAQQIIDQINEIRDCEVYPD